MERLVWETLARAIQALMADKDSMDELLNDITAQALLVQYVRSFHTGIMLKLRHDKKKKGESVSPMILNDTDLINIAGSCVMFGILLGRYYEQAELDTKLKPWSMSGSELAH